MFQSSAFGRLSLVNVSMPKNLLSAFVLMYTIGRGYRVFRHSMGRGLARSSIGGEATSMPQRGLSLSLANIP